MRGLWTRPRAISSLRFMPPENVRTRSFLPAFELDEAERLVEAGSAVFPGDAVDDRVELEVLLRGQAVVERWILEDDADRAAHALRGGHHVEAAEARRAARRREQRAEHLDRGRLAGAVRPEKPEDLAFRDDEADGAHGLHLVEALRKVFYFDRGRGADRLAFAGPS